MRSVASGVAMVGVLPLGVRRRCTGNAGVAWYELSIVPFVLAFLRYALLVERGEGGAPEDVVLHDRPLQVLGVLWVVLVGDRPLCRLTRAALPGDERLLDGLGRHRADAAPASSTPLNDDDVGRLLDGAPARGVVARGLGRAYGDAAQNAGGLVLDATALAGHRSPSTSSAGVVTAGAGTSLEDAHALARAARLVRPGHARARGSSPSAARSRRDIHGKGHHVDGTFGSNVLSITLLTGSGEMLTVTPDETPEIFWATVGGMGLTGVILDATFELIPVETSLHLASTRSAAPTSTHALASMEESDDAYHYSVAWIDCSARGRSTSVAASSARATTPGSTTSRRRSARTRTRFTPALPRAGAAGDAERARQPAGPCARSTSSGSARRASATAARVQDLGLFFHPLDMIDGWKPDLRPARLRPVPVSSCRSAREIDACATSSRC